MKKIIFVVSLLFITKFASAQEFRFGLRLSPIIAFAGVTDKDKNTITGLSTSSRIGFAGGLMATYQFTEKFGLHSGLNIVYKGYQYSTSSPNLTTKASLTTVEIPLALHMRTNEISNGLRIRGLFGASFNILASTKTDVTLISATTTTKNSDGYYKLVPDFIFGAGVEWSLRDAGTFDLGLRFNLPLFLATDKLNRVSTTNPSSSIMSSDGRIRVSYVSLDLGYYF
jgi:hypothetical protein